jgi:hypothetical protein
MVLSRSKVKGRQGDAKLSNQWLHDKNTSNKFNIRKGESSEIREEEKMKQWKEDPQKDSEIETSVPKMCQTKK